MSPGQLHYALKKAKKVHNYHPSLRNYHDLFRFEDSSIDIAFIIEALCYSTAKEKVFKELHRVLAPKGIFIVYDGYLKDDRKLTSNQKLACKLTEVGMAVPRLETHQEFLNKAKSNGFNIIEDDDVSLFIMPTLKRFEKLAYRFFKYPELAKIITKVFPHEFIYNAISGFLMPNLIKEKIATYHITVLIKK